VSKQIQKLFENVKPGDLICVDWCDASTGKSSMNGGVVDVPVRSWGVFLGVIEGRIKHIILAQNSFRFTDSIFDLDYTAIPLGWTIEVKVVAASHIEEAAADDMMRSFAKNSNSQARLNTAGLRSPRMSVFVHRMQRIRHDEHY